MRASFDDADDAMEASRRADEACALTPEEGSCRVRVASRGRGVGEAWCRKMMTRTNRSVTRRRTVSVGRLGNARSMDARRGGSDGGEM